MKYATTATFRDNLSAYLRAVESGERVIVLRRDTPVAEFGPPSAQASDVDGLPSALLKALEREGVIRCGTGQLPAWFFEPLPDGPPSGALAGLLSERGDDR